MSENNKNFDLKKELEEIDEPDYVKRAFVRVVDVSSIKNKSELNKKFKDFIR